MDVFSRASDIPYKASPESDANTDRIVTCVNDCVGIESPKQAFSALIEALERAVAHAESHDDYDWIGAAVEALELVHSKNAPCERCGRRDLPLYANGKCPVCHTPEAGDE